MDEFYLSEDTIEWLGLKKSEYLSRLIENIDQDDVQFEEYLRFDEMIPSTLSLPDWSIETIEDSMRVKTFCRTFADPEVLHQIVIGAIIADQEKTDVFVPIISFVTRKEKMVNLFSAGKISRPTLN
jgi:hypothetical protein